MGGTAWPDPFTDAANSCVGSNEGAGHKTITPNGVMYIGTVKNGVSDGGLTAINLH